jgi:hypothetical protein
MSRGRLLAPVAAMVAVALGVLALWQFDSPRLGSAVLAKASEATGVRLEVDGFALGLLSGLALDGASASASIPGGHYELALERLLFEHRLLPLLRGTVAIDQVVVERPRLRLVVGSGETPGAGDAVDGSDVESGGGPPLTFEVREIRIVEGSVELRDESGELAPTLVEGLGLTLRKLSADPGAPSPMQGAQGEGELSVGRIALESTEVRDVRGAFSLSGGRLETRDVTFSTPEGRFEAVFSMDVAGIPPSYELELRGRPLDLNVATGVPGQDGGFGPAQLDLAGHGTGTESRGLVATGRVTLAAGKLPSHPVLAGVARGIGRAAIAGAPYEATEVRFRISEDRLVLEPFALVSPDLALRVGGRVGLDPEGALDLELAVDVPREGVVVEGVGGDVLDALTDERGWLSVPMRVTGTSESPSVRPDAGALAAQARRGLGRSLKQKVGGKLKGLFGR